MPYRINKLLNPCEQSDGDKGNWSLTYTTKSGKKVKNCHTSKSKARAQIAAIEAESFAPKIFKYLSHNFEPNVGDFVKNTNSSCKHYGSEGEVYSIIPLENDAGTLCKYVCTNSGDDWDVGDILIKTLDQISPISNELWKNSNQKLNLSSDLKYHIDQDLGIKESIYRPGSYKFVSLIKEMRDAWKRKEYKPKIQDYEILFETQIGEIATFDNRLVYLDFPMPNDNNNSDFKFNHYISFLNENDYNQAIKTNQLDLNKEIKIYPIDNVTNLNSKNDFYSIIFESKINHNDFLINESKQQNKININILMTYSNKKINEVKKFLDNSKILFEAEYKGKKVNVGKPQRGGAKKKYKVYVKNSKGNIIKVEFGDIHGGLTSKISNPEARKSFVARHNCDSKNDKTKPGYWSCRLPRYWKQLGLKKTSYKWW